MKRMSLIAFCLAVTATSLAWAGGKADKPAKPGKAKAPPAAAQPAPTAPAGGSGELWRVTTTIQIPGAPVSPPPMTYEYCKTDKDAVPRNISDPQQSGCKILEHKFDAKQGTWKIMCEREDMKMTGEGRIAYSGDTFSGELRFKATGQDEDFEMVQQMSGQKLGPCKR